MTARAEVVPAGPRRLSGAAARRFAITRTRAARAVADIRDLEHPDPRGTAELLRMAGELAPYSAVAQPLLRTPEWASESVLEVLAANAAAASAAAPVLLDRKRNSGVSKRVDLLLDRLGVTGYVARETGLALAEVPGSLGYSSYIFYDEPGSFLQWHVDNRDLVDVSLLLCLDRVDGRSPREASATVCVLPDGFRRHHIRRGECLIFDGAFMLHGRTPVADGERVSLLRIGFKLRNKEEA